MDRPEQVNEPSRQDESIAIQLYSQQEKKIERIRNEASDVIKTMLLHGQKLDQLSERVNEGVAKTGIKTWEKVNEISTLLKDIVHHDEKQDLRLDNNEKVLSRFTSGVFWVAIIGVMGGLVSLMFWVIRTRWG